MQIQKKLKQLYKQLTIPQVSWMGDMLAIQEHYVQLKLESSNQLISHKQLFDDINAKRIFVEGLPGYGKTTLAVKIAYDWSSNEPYTQKFHFLFLLKVRELQKSVFHEIINLVKVCGYDKAQRVRRIISKEQDKILLILDGLDEVRLEERKKIFEILYKREMKEMTVLVTCRSGQFSLQPNENVHLFRGLPIQPNFYDQHVTILGISNQTQFLETFLHNERKSVEKVLKHLQNMMKHEKDFFHSPLMLILLADMIIRGDNTIGPTTTTTNFYKDVVDVMIRRSEERRNKFVDKPFSVFHTKNKENSWFKLKLKQFGYLCFQRVWNGSQLEFDQDEDDLMKNIEKLGIIIEHKTLTNAGCKNYYQIYHKTMMEFMAAYYIYEDFIDNSFIFSQVIQQCLIYDLITYRSMVSPFLIGMMKERASDYFTLISTKYTDIFQKHQTILWQMLMECECIEDIQTSVIPNLPTRLHFKQSWRYSPLSNFICSNLHKRLVTLGVENGCIKCIYVDMRVKLNLPTDVELPSIFIRVDRLKIATEECIEMNSQLKLIKCQSCYLDAEYLFDRFLFNDYFKLMLAIPAKSYIFDGDKNLAIHLMHNVDFWPENIIINTLKVNFHNLSDLAYKAICNLLDICHVNELHIYYPDNETDLNKFFPHCKKVKHLKLTSRDNEISMDSLFQDKQWQSMDLKRVQLTAPTNLHHFYSCQTFRVTSASTKLAQNQLLFHVKEINLLECNTSTFFINLLNCPTWPSLNTITKLILHADQLVFDCHVWSESLNSFVNLRELTILIDQSLILTQIFPYLLSLPIHTLTIELPPFFDNAISVVEDLTINVRNVTRLSKFVIQFPLPQTDIERKKWSLTNIESNFLVKCQQVLKYCLEEKIFLKHIVVHFPDEVKSWFNNIKQVNNINIKYSFSTGVISILVSSN